MSDKKMGSGKGVKINTTENYEYGQVPGIADTITGMEQWDMNVVNDVGGSHSDFNGPSTLGGKGKGGK